jgi:hypothetical protein
MQDEPQAKVFPRGLANEDVYENFPDGPPTVVLTHRGCHFVFRFAKDDLAGESGVRKLEVVSAEGDTLDPKALRRFAPQVELYLAYVRAGMRMHGGGPLDEADPETDLRRRHEDIREAAKALRDVGGPGRGLSDEFYRLISRHYAELVGAGEPHPVKALGQAHHVTTSAASRWLTAARAKGLLEEAGDAS